MTRWRRGVASVGTAFALVLATRAVVLAHAMLVSAEPPANSRLASGPSRVRLVFSEELDPSLAHIWVVANAGVARELKAGGDPRDVRAVIAPTEALPPGAYRVRWRVVSADGHPVEGSYAFFVGATSAAPPPSEPSASPETVWGPALFGAPIAPALLRGLGVGALIALTGLLGFVVSAPAPASKAAGPAARRLVVALAIATPALLTLHFVVWLLNASPTHSIGGDETAALLRSGVSRVEEWRVGLAALVLWAVALTRRLPLALAIGVVATLVSGAIGHSAAMRPFIAIPARSLHLAAGAAWLGGLIWLGVVRTAGRDEFRGEALRVSRVALWSVVVVVLSGVAQLLVFLPSPGALFTSAYGAIASAKMAGLCLLVGFGVYHRTRSLPRLTQGSASATPILRAVRAELLVMLIVILLGGWLAYVSPPSPPPSAAHARM